MVSCKQICTLSVRIYNYRLLHTNFLRNFSLKNCIHKNSSRSMRLNEQKLQSCKITNYVQKVQAVALQKCGLSNLYFPEIFVLFHVTGLSIQAEYIRKVLVFWCFKAVKKETSRMKWFKQQYVNSTFHAMNAFIAMS